VRLLVTRPEPAAERTAAVLRTRGHEVIASPLLRVEFLSPELGRGPWRALALTSPNAARAIESHPRRAELVALPAFVVGRGTGAAAQAAGFAKIHSADGDVDDLARLIAARFADGALLHLAGENRAGDLGGALSPLGMAVETAVVYRAAKVSAYTAAAGAALADGRIDGVLHYSRRSAEAYLDCAKAGGLLTPALVPRHFCLSQRVAHPLGAAGAADLRVAPRPDEGALLDLIAAS
jgi:uroporphyrinogen-III synthase